MTTTVPNTTDPKRSNYCGPCPRCGGAVPNAENPGLYPGALSRYDNQTYICSSCETAEAFAAGHLIPLDVPLHSEQADAIRAAALAGGAR